MLKVMLVDDEPSVLEGLRLFVNWGQLGFEIIGEASDGASSFSLIRDLRPDLVICDIRMPGLSGLELIEKVNTELAPPPKFILLSGYNDFTYARRALQLGALGYLTKPLDAEELEGELSRVSGIIENERAEKQENLELIRYTANQLYNDIMDGKHSEKLMRKAHFIFDIPENSKIRIIQFITETVGNTANNPESKMYDFLMQLTGIKNENCIFYNGSGNYIIILHEGMDVFSSEPVRMEKLEEAFWDVDSSDYGFNNFWALVSGISEDKVLSSILKSGRQLEQLQAYCMLYPDKRFFYYNDIEDSGAWEEQSETQLGNVFPELPFDRIISSLKGNDLDQVQSSVEEFFQKLNQTGASRRLYSICLYRLADLVKKMAYAYGIDAGKVILKFTRAIDSITPNCKNLALEMCTYIFRKQNVNNEKPLLLLENEIIDHIKANYRESLSLQSIAEKFSLSPIIISKIIKKKTGQKFNDYFNFLRIEFAKTLIASADLKMSAICEQSGYSDYRYFTEKFKEFTGVSPSEYKKKYS